MPRTMSRAEARAFYDRFGAKQDLQGFYENPALDALVRHGRFGEARRVMEFGCGTGRLAARLLGDCLPADAEYTAIDASHTMIELTRARLAPWAERVKIVEADTVPEERSRAGGWERFVSTYVLELLSPEDIGRVLARAHEALAPGGRLGLVGLTFGGGALGRTVTGLWRAAHAFRPQWVGGCRPLRLEPYLPEDRWRIEHREVVQSFGIASEVVWACPVADAATGG